MKIRLLTMLALPALLAPLALSGVTSAAASPTTAQIVCRMEAPISSHLSGTITRTQLGEVDASAGDRFGNTFSASTATYAGKVVRWSHALVGEVFYLRMDGPTLSSQLGLPYMSSTAAAKYGSSLGGKWLYGGVQSPKVLATLNWGTQFNHQVSLLVSIAGKSLVLGKPITLHSSAMFTLTSPEIVIYVSESTYLPAKTIVRSGALQTETINYGHVARITAAQVAVTKIVCWPQASLRSPNP
jgi:hypothetical protein